MATLAAVQLEDLPVVVKFILHSVSSSDAYEVRYLSCVHSILHLKKHNIANVPILLPCYYCTFMLESKSLACVYICVGGE